MGIVGKEVKRIIPPLKELHKKRAYLANAAKAANALCTKSDYKTTNIDLTMDVMWTMCLFPHHPFRCGLI